RCAPGWSCRNTILYGHRMNDGSMFAGLRNYFDKSFLNSHREIHIYTEGYLRVYEVFSVHYASAGDDSYTVAFSDGDEYALWLETIASRSAVDAGERPEAGQDVLLLSTCKGGENEDRTVVFAALSRIIARQ
ncbi:MAG: class B sortase, partial [Oscillospiraceae bacterium]|nr:class B sortase [Oscillospiraceae bacterium]